VGVMTLEMAASENVQAVAEGHIVALEETVGWYNRPDRDGEAVYSKVQEYVNGEMRQCSLEVRQVVLAGIRPSLSALTTKGGSKMESDTLVELEQMILGNN